MQELVLYSSALLGLMLVFLWIWTLYVAYPMEWERSMKRGKAWIYIPPKWTGARRFLVIQFSRILLLTCAAATALIAGLLFRQQHPALLVTIGVLSLLIYFWLHRRLLKRRLRQQEDSYFCIQDQLNEAQENQGKTGDTLAARNLASFRHQNLMRTADQEGKLIRTLRSQAKLYKTRKMEMHSKLSADSRRV